jgi:hypothetical protein
MSCVWIWGGESVGRLIVSLRKRWEVVLRRCSAVIGLGNGGGKRLLLFIGWLPVYGWWVGYVGCVDVLYFLPVTILHSEFSYVNYIYCFPSFVKNKFVVRDVWSQEGGVFLLLFN